MVSAEELVGLPPCAHEGCDKPAWFGFGVKIRAGRLGTHLCQEHKHEGERFEAEERDRGIPIEDEAPDAPASDSGADFDPGADLFSLSP